MKDSNMEHENKAEQKEIIHQETLHEEKLNMATFSHHYAGFWIRFWAYLLDIVVIESIYSLIFRPTLRFLSFGDLHWSWISVEDLLHATLFYVYFVLFTKLLGKTIGKMAFGVKVIREDGTRLRWQDVLFREWIGRYISATLVIAYIVVAFIPKKKGLHDLFADTVVIHEETVTLVKAPPIATS